MKKMTLWITLSVSLTAFTNPKVGDLVEISDWLSGRSSGHFRKIDKNRVMNLPAGTQGKIEKVKFFRKTGNYGLCLELPESASCVWVYYNTKNPRLKLLNQAEQNTDRIEEAISARTVTETPAIQDESEKTAPADSMNNSNPDQNDGIDLVQRAIESVTVLNQEAAEIINPQPTCENCQVQLQSYAQCNSKNSYLESSLAAIRSSAEYSSLFSSRQNEIIRPACIQRAMEVASTNPASYRNCESNQDLPKRNAGRACNSKNHVEITAKSFNAVSDCLGDFVSGSVETKPEASLMILFLTAHESGMQMNAVSQTGAAGIGQMTSSAIKAVNRILPQIKEHLMKSNNPVCSQVLTKSIASPMSSSRGKLCERIGINHDNPLKNIIYTFALQSVTRKYVDSVMSTFSEVLSPSLNFHEKERLYQALSGWSHNTGTGGMAVPLRVHLSQYLRSGKKISNKNDVDQFLKELAMVMKHNPHKDNRSIGRRNETSKFYAAIQKRQNDITSEASSCLAN